MQLPQYALSKYSLHRPLSWQDEYADLADVQCDAELHDWQWLTEARHSLPSLPMAVAGRIPFATSHSTLLRQLGIWEVWERAAEDQAATDAIEACIGELVSFWGK